MAFWNKKNKASEAEQNPADQSPADTQPEPGSNQDEATLQKPRAEPSYSEKPKKAGIFASVKAAFIRPAAPSIPTSEMSGGARASWSMMSFLDAYLQFW